MNAREWFQAYVDAVDVASCLMRCTTEPQTRAFWSRTMHEYRAAKGLEYADSVAVQTDNLLEGVQAMHTGEDV